MPFLNPYSNLKEAALLAPRVTEEKREARAEQLHCVKLSECERQDLNEVPKDSRPGCGKEKEGRREGEAQGSSIHECSFKTRTRTRLFMMESVGGIPGYIKVMRMSSSHY